MKRTLLTALCLVLLTLTAACVLVNSSNPPVSQAPGGAPIRDGRFANPHTTELKKSFFSYVRMRFLSDEPWADYAATADKVPVTVADIDNIARPDPDVLQATWIGHATVLIQYRGKTVLTDPIFSNRASPVSFAGPTRVTQPAISIDALPAIDLIVISHNHYDHVDLKSLRELEKKTKQIVVPLGLAQWMREKTDFGDRVTEYDWWQSREQAGIGVTATPSQHWSGRGFGDRFKTLWAAWALTLGDRTVWFGGDTGYNDKQFREIGRRISRIDLAIIPIGAYAPRWFMKTMHVNPEEAVLIHQDVQARQSIGVHWGAFPLTSEPIDEPPARLRAALVERGLSQDEFRALSVGEMLTLP